MDVKQSVTCCSCCEAADTGSAWIEGKLSGKTAGGAEWGIPVQYRPVISRCTVLLSTIHLKMAETSMKSGVMLIILQCWERVLFAIFSFSILVLNLQNL